MDWKIEGNGCRILPFREENDMKNLLKKGILFLLCVILGAAFLATGGIGVNAKNPVRKGATPQGLELANHAKSMKEQTSGVCGENIVWTYDKASRTLEFSGTGVIYDTEGAVDGCGLIGSWSVWKYEAQQLIIGEGITEIGYANFYEFLSLKSISFPSTLITIGEVAFYNSFHSKPISIVLPANLKKIGRSAFAASYKRESKLVGVTLPNGLERLGDYVFQGQPIKEIVLPGTIQYMDYGTLDDCWKLEKLTIESGVEMLPFQMCSGCTALKTVEIPSTVREIRGCAFYECKKLKKIKIPEGVQAILDAAFCESGITKITIPDTVKTLGDNLFWNCSQLKQVRLPSHLSVIRSGLFLNCKKLEHIKIPKTVTFVYMSAFGGSGLKKLVLPENVTRLAKDKPPVDPDDLDLSEIRDLEMKQLQQLVIESTKLKKVSKGTFSCINKNCVIKVPKTKIKKYKKMIYGSGIDKKIKVKANKKS